MKNPSLNRQKITVFIFFAVFLCLGLSIFKDYGISWDEPRSRYNGVVAAKYIIKQDKELLNYPDRYYGTAFETFLVGIEGVLNLTKNSRATYLMRHLLTFLLFFCGVFFFYLLVKYNFSSWKIGLLGSLFLVLSPRIFADAFYNSKDLPFLSVFIISIYTLIRYLDKKLYFRAASFHAIVCALLIDIRIAGIIVPVFTYAFFIRDLLINKSEPAKIKKEIATLSLYTLLLVFFTILFWPVLWKRPLYHFIMALNEMKQYTAWAGTVLYLGNYLDSRNLPWHYASLWVVITTPLLYSFCFLFGCWFSIRAFLSPHTYSRLSKRNNLIFILWLFTPLLSAIIFKSVLYDAWRQLFFIYPAFLIISLLGLVSLWGIIKKRFKRSGLQVVNAVFLVFVLIWLINPIKFMLQYHPYQNLYFNILAGRNMQEIKKNFELDYWGLSYRKALEYILKNDSSNTIKVFVANYPGKYNSYILTNDEQKRLLYVDRPEDAGYFLSNYRWHKQDYPYKEEYYSIKIEGVKIMVIYKL